jgi:archaellum component FlaC
MKFSKQDGLLILIGILVLLNIFNTNKIKTDIKGYENKIENLQIKIDSATVINKLLDNKMDSVNTYVTEITNEINHIDNNISIIKKQTNEKVNVINTYTASELEQFFTDRYNESKNK